MQKRFMALIMTLIMSIVLLIGTLEVLNLVYASGAPEIFTIVTRDNALERDDVYTETNQVYLNEVFTVRFYVRNFDTIISAVIPTLYDYDLAVLLAHNGDEVNGTTHKMDIVSYNPDFVLVDNAQYPRFDIEEGKFSLWLQANSMLRPNGDELFLFAIQFRAIAEGDFEVEFAQSFDGVSPWGATIYSEGGNLELNPTQMHQSSNLNAADLRIGRLRSAPPEYVIVHINLDGTATVIVAGDWENGAIITLYDPDGKQIGTHASVNEHGNAVFFVPADDIPENGRFYATATEPYKNESKKVAGEPFDTDWIIVYLEDPRVIIVPFGTSELVIPFLTRIEGQIGLRTIDRETGEEIGVFIPDELPSSINFDGYFDVASPPGWTSTTYDSQISGEYDFIGSPVPPNYITNPNNLTATQQVVVLPEGYFNAVIFVNAGPTFWQIVATNETATRPDPDPEREGYKFLGWFLEGTNTVFDFNTPISELTVLEAKWLSEETFTITGALVGRSIVSNQTITYEVTVVEPRSGTVQTNINGNYSITDIPYGATITITAPAPDSGWTVSPSRNITDLNVRGNLDRRNFYYTRTGGTTIIGGGGGGGGGGIPLSTLRIDCINEYNEIIFTQTIERVAVGSTQTVNAPDLEGYVLNDSPTKTITIVSNAAQNVVVFRYITEDAPPQLERDDHFRYLFGYEDGTIRPEWQVTREEVATIFFRLLTQETRSRFRTNWHTFPDVESGRWSNQQIATMQNAGILQGDWEYGTFRPGDPITRAEFAIIAMRFDNIGLSYEHDFDDIVGHWAERNIAAAVYRGWVTGYPDGTFRPDQHITRAEAATLINRVLGRSVDQYGLYAPIVVHWPDLSNTHWAYFEIMEASISHVFVRRYDDIQIIENWTGAGDDVDFGEVLFLPGTFTAYHYVPEFEAELQIGYETEHIPEQEYILHTVNIGDTLSGLAVRYNTSITEIMYLNDLDSDVIQLGQTLRIVVN